MLRVEITQEKRFVDFLNESKHIHAYDISIKLGISIYMVYSMIRRLRKKGVGIMYIPRKGYLLAEFADKKDDVGFFRGLLGRRASDWYAIQSCERHIKKRWNTNEDRKLLSALIKEVQPSPKMINSMYVTLRESELKPSQVMKVKPILISNEVLSIKKRVTRLRSEGVK